MLMYIILSHVKYIRRPATGNNSFRNLRSNNNSNNSWSNKLYNKSNNNSNNFNNSNILIPSLTTVLTAAAGAAAAAAATTTTTTTIVRPLQASASHSCTFEQHNGCPESDRHPIHLLCIVEAAALHFDRHQSVVDGFFPAEKNPQKGLITALF